MTGRTPLLGEAHRTEMACRLDTTDIPDTAVAGNLEIRFSSGFRGSISKRNNPLCVKGSLCRPPAALDSHLNIN